MTAEAGHGFFFGLRGTGSLNQIDRQVPTKKEASHASSRYSTGKKESEGSRAPGQTDGALVLERGITSGKV